NFYVLRETNMPAVLIEHGFYTNKEECELLKSGCSKGVLLPSIM
ncbi:MAG: N-acetylmuramoyl-L-alanine amidase, partial [Acetomicrobium sp.]|nr:N-acetylmuramoyl-L-alanine amidase [Acetomicrobium sp.]